jgi:hypothetical protein
MITKIVMLRDTSSQFISLQPTQSTNSTWIKIWSCQGYHRRRDTSCLCRCWRRSCVLPLPSTYSLSTSSYSYMSSKASWTRSLLIVSHAFGVVPDQLWSWCRWARAPCATLALDIVTLLHIAWFAITVDVSWSGSSAFHHALPIALELWPAKI